MPDETLFAPCPVIVLRTCGDAFINDKQEVCFILNGYVPYPDVHMTSCFFYLISIKAGGSMAACHLPQKLLQFLGMHRFSKIIALNIVQSHGFYLLIFRLCLHTLQQNTNIHIMAQSDNKLNKGRIKFTV